MRYSTRVRCAVNTVLPTLRATQATNLALLVSAILIKRTLCLSELARAYPRATFRRVHAPSMTCCTALSGCGAFSITTG